MICSVLCVGTELLLGQIQDTNSTFIGEQLAHEGINSYEHRRVGDNPERIARAVTDLLENSDALIVTGGLGPTHDDITREVVAGVMGVDLVINQEVVAQMEALFAKRKRKMTGNNLRQAMVPVGATVIHNPSGTAPGLVCPIEIAGVSKNVYLTPGVPHEMKPMITDFIIPQLVQEAGQTNTIVTRTLKTWGLPESVLAEMLDDIVVRGETGDVKVGFLARGINGIYVKLSTTAETREEALVKISHTENEVVELLGDSLFAYDSDTMESVVTNMLIEKGLTLSVAESLTGGMIASRLVDVAGVSEVLKGAVVSYAESVKSDVLGVDVEDVYSHQCAQQMAAGVRNHLSSAIAISTTGVAGPESVDGHQPGEVFVGLSTEEENLSYDFALGGDRIRVREYAAITALNVLRKHLLGLRYNGQSSK